LKYRGSSGVFFCCQFANIEPPPFSSKRGGGERERRMGHTRCCMFKPVTRVEMGIRGGGGGRTSRSPPAFYFMVLGRKCDWGGATASLIASRPSSTCWIYKNCVCREGASATNRTRMDVACTFCSIFLTPDLVSDVRYGSSSWPSKGGGAVIHYTVDRPTSRDGYEGEKRRKDSMVRSRKELDVQIGGGGKDPEGSWCST